MKSDKSIKKSKYFSKLEELDFYALLRCLQAQVKTFYKDEIIVHDGDSTNYCYIIHEGLARSYKIEIDGTRNIINDYPSSSVFGIDYYIQNKKYYREHLVALTDVVVIICNSFRFINPCENRCKRHIDFVKLVNEDLTRQLTELKQRNQYMLITKTRDKILAYLKNQKSLTRKQIFTIPYNRQELADYLGVERSALSVELSKLKKEGIIDYDKSSFKILKKD